jgi:hypothetical protein
VHTIADAMIIIAFGIILLFVLRSQHIYSPLLLHHQHKWQHGEKGKYCLNIN